MASYELQVPRLRDRDIFRFFRDIAELIGAQSFTINELGGASGTYTHSEPTSNEKSYLWDSELFTVYTASIGVTGFSMHLVRSSSETFSDKLNINVSDNNQKPDADVIRAVNRLISATFEASHQPLVGAIGGQKAVAELIKSHQQMLSQLQSSATSITETIAKAHANLEQEFAKRAAQLDEDYQNRSAKADETLEVERKALRDREDALTLRSRELDDRDNTTARRAQHATLKSRIAERAKSFAITPETRAARMPIHIATGITCLVILIFLYRYSSSLSELPAAASLALILAAAVKPIGLTIALLGLVAWYLRWLNRWFERHADTEFYLKQFELDIDRANWVVETALEWKEKQDRTIPDGLLDSISRNIFTKSEKDVDADMHPADYLASAILGRASNVSLKVPGGEISLTGKDIKKLQKDDAG